LLADSLAISDQLSAISPKDFFVSADGCVLTADGYSLSTDDCSYEHLIAPDTLKSSYDNLI